MKRIKLVVAYDGTAYCGWQLQPNGPTIEGELNQTLSDLLGEEIKVTGASRTDAGVHSLGNVAIFDTDSRIPPEKFSYALNRRLPGDIVVVDSTQVEDDWHPRKCESRKTYEYRVLNRRFPDPTRRLDHYFYHYPLDVEAMKKAASYLEGEHDFSSFCSANSQAEDHERTIYSCQVEKSGDEIRIRVCGSGFLYNMVRIIAGTLIAIGGGERKPEEMEEIIEAKDRSAAGPTAPACGLTMLGIDYLVEPEVK